MSKHHILGIALAANDIAGVASHALPEDTDTSPLNTHLQNTEHSLHQAISLADSGDISSVMHTHDAVHHLGNAVSFLQKHIPSGDWGTHLLAALKAHEAAKILASQHEKDFLP